jgi:hypothetical protein
MGKLSSCWRGQSLLEECRCSVTAFSVPQPATSLLSHSESSIGPFWSRIKMFGLEQFAAKIDSYALILRLANDTLTRSM